jgi:hypothetical protein
MIGSAFWEKNIIAAHSGKKHDWQHILRKTMIGTFWGKKNMTSSTFCEKTRLAAHSWKKHDCSTFWEIT